MHAFSIPFDTEVIVSFQYRIGEYREYGKVVDSRSSAMKFQLGGSNPSTPRALIGVGIAVFLLGCVWPAIVYGDFTDEVDSRNWDTVDATVNYMDIDSYEYECGDDESSSTCTQYEVTYTLQFEVRNMTYFVTDTEDVSYFESRVWEVDYPTNSIRNIAYESSNPENIDYDPGNFAPFILPALVGLFATTIAALFIIGGIRLAIAPKDDSDEDDSSIPMTDEEIHFSVKKSLWGEQHFAHPSVEALAMKMKSFSCSDKQIQTFFENCRQQQKDSAYPVDFSNNWLREVEVIMDQHDSHTKYDVVGKIKLAQFGFAVLGAVMFVLAMIVNLPMFMKYDALDWYGWVLVWATLAPIGLIFVANAISKEMSKFVDQGLGEILIEFSEGPDVTKLEDHI